MGLLTKVIDVIAGGFGSKLVDTVKDYFPPNMSPQEKADFEMRLMEATRTHEMALIEAANEADREFNQRIRDLEGTAKDLAVIPVLGPVMLFLRGCQRPIFGAFTLIMDYCVFSGTWTIAEGSRLEAAFFAINLLVLGFLFGERAVRNVLPLLERYMGKGGHE